MAAITKQQVTINISNLMFSMHQHFRSDVLHASQNRMDLLAFVQKRQQEGHGIILMGDLNEAY
jgi:hypothetical protein